MAKPDFEDLPFNSFAQLRFGRLEQLVDQQLLFSGFCPVRIRPVLPVPWIQHL
jgi:hypothetical protein